MNLLMVLCLLFGMGLKIIGLLKFIGKQYLIDNNTTVNTCFGQRYYKYQAYFTQYNYGNERHVTDKIKRRIKEQKIKKL